MSLETLLLAYVVAFCGSATTAALVIKRREGRLGATGWLRVAMVSCLAIGTVSHIHDGLRAGLTPHPTLPMAVNLFWAALTLLDPLAAVLLVWRARFGIALTVLIMVFDISINTVFLGPSAALAFQVGFGVFVAVAAVPCWNAARSSSPQPVSPA